MNIYVYFASVLQFPPTILIGFSLTLKQDLESQEFLLLYIKGKANIAKEAFSCF